MTVGDETPVGRLRNALWAADATCGRAALLGQVGVSAPTLRDFLLARRQPRAATMAALWRWAANHSGDPAVSALARVRPVTLDEPDRTLAQPSASEEPVAPEELERLRALVVQELGSASYRALAPRIGIGHQALYVFVNEGVRPRGRNVHKLQTWAASRRAPEPGQQTIEAAVRALTRRMTEELRESATRAILAARAGGAAPDAGRVDHGVPSAVSGRLTSVEEIRAAVVRAVEERGLRPTAREIGCAVNALDKFAGGSTPLPRTVRRLRHWLVRRGDGSDADAEEVLTEHMVGLERTRARVVIREVVDRSCLPARRSGYDFPSRDDDAWGGDEQSGR